MVYVDGFLLAVPTANKAVFKTHVAEAAALFREHGVLRVVECWGDDVPHGKTTDFYMAVKAKEDETVCFSWMEWPSKEARDAGWARVMADQRMAPGSMSMPFDGARMIYGGFAPVLDTSS